MTVGELRNTLEGVPDDAKLWVNAENSLMLEYGDCQSVDYVGYDKALNSFDIDI